MTLPTCLPRGLLTVVIFGLCSASVLADANHDSPGGPGPCEMHRDGPPPHPMGPGFGPPGSGFGAPEPEGEEGLAPPYLHGIDLSEDQQDKVFAILHDVAPLLRQQGKAVRKAHEGLRALGQSAEFSTGSAAQLAQNAGAAETQIALLHARIEHDIYSILTVDQRKRLSERAAEHRAPGPGEGPR